MEMDGEDDSEKTFATLTNVNLEPVSNYQLQFEEFIVAERSDEDSEGEIDEDGEQSDQDDGLYVPGDENDEPENEGDVQNNEDGTQEKENVAINNEEDENSFMENPLRDIYSSSCSQEYTLKSDEVAIIESCHHEELKKLLEMNRSKNFHLMHLYKKVKDLLVDCRSDIASINKLTSNANSIDNQPMFLTHLAAPYFKTKKEMFSSKPNEDTIARRKNGELSIYQNVVIPKWSKNECDNLINAVKMTYNHNKQKAVLKKISSLRFKLERDEKSSDTGLKIIEEIDGLERELKCLKEIGKKDIPPLGQNEFIDWEHISSEYLLERHNALECRSFWHIYLHPEINKSNWAKQENVDIKSLAVKYNQQNWDQIALELGTKRSGFSVCLHYLSVLGDHFSREKFTKEEDDMILEHVARMRIGSYIPWNAIEVYFPQRSRYQIVHRYKYFLDARNCSTVSFTDAEDILILILVDRFGRNYSKFMGYIPNRSYMQIKNRYDMYLKISPRKGSFTVEDDEVLLKYTTEEPYMCTSTLCNLLHRTRFQVRQRLRTLRNFLQKNPDSTVADAPRRQIARDESMRKFEFLKCIAEQYKDHHDVPTTEEIEEKLGMKTSKNDNKRTKKKTNYNVDSLLINFFSNSYKLKQKPIETTTHKIQQSAETIYNILSKWKVNLEIPDELRKTSYLDVFDLEILNSLRDKYNSNIDSDITTAVEDLVPPNINTLIGLRSLLLKNKLFKIKSKVRDIDGLTEATTNDEFQIASDINEVFRKMDPQMRTRVENERCIFLERIISLFMWPAIFSVEPPSELLLDSELGINMDSHSKNKKNQKVIEQNRRKGTSQPHPTENIDIQDPKVNRIKTNLKQIKRSTDDSDNAIAKKTKLSTKTKQTNVTTRTSLRAKRCSTRLKNTTAEPSEDNDNSLNSANVQIPTNLDEFHMGKNNTKPLRITKKDNIRTKSANNVQSKNANLKLRKIIKIVKIQSKKNEAEKAGPQDQEKMLSCLKKVNKNEVEKILDSQKSVQMFRLQRIKLENGSMTTVTTPIQREGMSLLCNKNNSQYKIHNRDTKSVNTTLNDKVDILHMVSLAASVKRTNTTSQTIANSKPEQIQNTDLIDLQKLKTVLHKNINHISSTNEVFDLTDEDPSENINSEDLDNNILKDKEDLNKLDIFLQNLEHQEDGVIDLTEDEIMRNDVNEMFKTENNV